MCTDKTWDTYTVVCRAKIIFAMLPDLYNSFYVYTISTIGFCRKFTSINLQQFRLFYLLESIKQNWKVSDIVKLWNYESNRIFISLTVNKKFIQFWQWMDDIDYQPYPRHICIWNIDDQCICDRYCVSYSQAYRILEILWFKFMNR